MPFNIKTEKFLSKENCKRIIAMGLSLKNGIESIEQDLIKEYDSSKTYVPNMACYYNDYLYRCLFTTTGKFDINSWKKVGDSLELVNKAQIEAMLGLTPDELDTLANIILDSEIRLDKTHSSSKIFSDMQDILSQSKKFTLEEFAKANKASYTVTDSVDTMTDQSTIYLLKNDTTYDMYIVQVDGTPTKIGDVNIDLSQFYTKTEIDNDFVKKTDADGKYATITTVDGKVDKTSILSSISSTPSDDKLLSEKAINDTLVKKTDITTTIDSASTDTQVPGALTVYNAIYNLVGLDKNYNILTIKRPPDEFEGGEIHLETPTTGCTLIGDIVIDIYGNCIRFFEGDGIHRGCKINLSNMKDNSSSNICTTNVEDVSPTSITNFDSSIFKGSINYEIKNGICYVSLNGFLSTVTGMSMDVCNFISPKMLQTASITSDNTGETIGLIYISTTKLKVHIYKSNVVGYCSFSYPVAES